MGMRAIVAVSILVLVMVIVAIVSTVNTVMAVVVVVVVVAVVLVQLVVMALMIVALTLVHPGSYGHGRGLCREQGKTIRQRRYAPVARRPGDIAIGRSRGHAMVV